MSSLSRFQHAWHRWKLSCKKPCWKQQRLQHPFRWRRHGSPSEFVWFLWWFAFTGSTSSSGSTGCTDSTGLRDGHVLRGTVPRRHCHCGYRAVVHRMQLSGLFSLRALALQTDSGERSILDHEHPRSQKGMTMDEHYGKSESRKRNPNREPTCYLNLHDGFTFLLSPYLAL